MTPHGPQDRPDWGTRHTRSDTHAKWTIGAVSAGILSLLSFLAVQDYRSVHDQLIAQQAAVVALQLADRDSLADRKRLSEIVLEIREGQDRLEAKLDRLLLRNGVAQMGIK